MQSLHKQLLAIPQGYENHIIGVLLTHGPTVLDRTQARQRRLDSPAKEDDKKKEQEKERERGAERSGSHRVHLAGPASAQAGQPTVNGLRWRESDRLAASAS